MATFHLIEPYADMSGKICSHSRIINVLGRKGVRRGKQWTNVICNPRDLSEHPYSANEQTAKERFKAVRLAIKAIKVNPTTLAQKYDAYKLVRDSYKSFDSFLWKTECDNWDLEHSDEDEEQVVQE